MTILKYLLLLFLLLFFGVAVTVATESAKYEFEVVRYIKSPQKEVFNYVKDYKNWSAWNVVAPATQYQLINSTKGVGGKLNWTEEENEISHAILETNKTDFIRQKMLFNDAASEWKWKFSSTLKGTKVILNIKGEAPFMYKVKASFRGGVQTLLKSRAEKSLSFLDKTLDYELNTFSIKMNGPVTKIGNYYLYQNINSKWINLHRNIKILIPKLMDFMKLNKIALYGKPFVLYHSNDTLKKISNISVCVPIKEEMYTSEGSEISGGSFETFQAMKSTLTGDYNHLNKIWKATMVHIEKTNEKIDTNKPVLELYTINNFNEKHPSKWQTQIYFPIKIKENLIKEKVIVTNKVDSLLTN